MTQILGYADDIDIMGRSFVASTSTRSFNILGRVSSQNWTDYTGKQILTNFLFLNILWVFLIDFKVLKKNMLAKNFYHPPILRNFMYTFWIIWAIL